MAWIVGPLRIMLILVIVLTLWDLSNCAVISTAAFLNSDDRERRKDLPTVPTLDYKRFSVDPVQNPTPAHFDWSRFTLPTFDWDRFNRITYSWDRDRTTFRPWNRDRITLRPYNFRHTASDYNALKLAIFLPTMFGIVIVLICKYFVCNGERNSQVSTPTLHTPPPQLPGVTSTQNNPWTTQNASQFSALSSGISRSNVTDRPPGYSDVVIADLSGNQNTFPEVKPTVPETPPPLYDDKIMRY